MSYKKQRTQQGQFKTDSTGRRQKQHAWTRQMSYLKHSLPVPETRSETERKQQGRGQNTPDTEHPTCTDPTTETRREN